MKNMYTKLHGQFGNQLYEIAATQYIANNNNYDLYLIENDKYRYKFNDIFEHHFNFVNKNSVEKNIKEISYEKLNIPFNEYVDFSNESDNVQYYHPFQNQKYWNYDKDFCIDLFKFSKEIENKIICKYDMSEIEDSFIIHVRKDYFNSVDHKIFTTQWFTNILKSENIIIFCDFPKAFENYMNAKHILKSNVKIISNELYDDFYLLTKAKNICIGASTFSWWATYLNKENNIYITNRTNNYMNNRLKKNNAEGYFFHNNIKVIQ